MPCNSGFQIWHDPLGKKSFITTHERTVSSETPLHRRSSLAGLLRTCNTRTTAIKHCQHHTILAQITTTSPSPPNTPTMELSWNRKDKQELQLHWHSLSLITHSTSLPDAGTSRSQLWRESGYWAAPYFSCPAKKLGSLLGKKNFMQRSKYISIMILGKYISVMTLFPLLPLATFWKMLSSLSPFCRC